MHYQWANSKRAAYDAQFSCIHFIVAQPDSMRSHRPSSSRPYRSGGQSELKRLDKRARMLAQGANYSSEALKLNTRILELQPNDAVALSRLVDIYLHWGNKQAAEDLCNLILAHNPFDWRAKNRLDELSAERTRAEDRARKEKGRQTYETQVMQLLTGLIHYEEAFAVGMIASRRHMYDLAVRVLQLTCKLRQTSAARVALAAVYRDMRDLRKAEKLLRSVLDDDPCDAAQVTLAAVLCDRGNLDEAYKLGLTVLKRDEQNVYALNAMGRICRCRGMLLKSIGYFNRATILGQPRAQDWLATLGQLGQKYATELNGESVGRVQKWRTMFGALPIYNEDRVSSGAFPPSA